MNCNIKNVTGIRELVKSASANAYTMKLFSVENVLFVHTTLDVDLFFDCYFLAQSLIKPYRFNIFPNSFFDVVRH